MGLMSEDFSLGTVQTSLGPMERFEEFLQTRNMRITQQRREILQHVFAKHDHFDVDELLDTLKQDAKIGKIGRATVYRTLKQLVDAGLLREMVLGGRSVYEHDYGYPQHDHLHCQFCDELIEFRSDELAKIRDTVAREHRFRVTGHRLIVNGICIDCQKARTRETRPVDLI